MLNQPLTATCQTCGTRTEAIPPHLPPTGGTIACSAAFDSGSPNAASRGTRASVLRSAREEGRFLGLAEADACDGPCREACRLWAQFVRSAGQGKD